MHIWTLPLIWTLSNICLVCKRRHAEKFWTIPEPNCEIISKSHYRQFIFDGRSLQSSVNFSFSSYFKSKLKHFVFFLFFAIYLWLLLEKADDRPLFYIQLSFFKAGHMLNWIILYSWKWVLSHNGVVCNMGPLSYRTLVHVTHTNLFAAWEDGLDYYNTPCICFVGEMGVQCYACLNWSQSDCAGIERDQYICDFCFQR